MQQKLKGGLVGCEIIRIAAWRWLSMLEKLIEAVENWDLTRGEARQREEAAMEAPPEGLKLKF